MSQDKTGQVKKKSLPKGYPHHSNSLANKSLSETMRDKYQRGKDVLASTLDKGLQAVETLVTGKPPAAKKGAAAAPVVRAPDPRPFVAAPKPSSVPWREWLIDNFVYPPLPELWKSETWTKEEFNSALLRIFLLVYGFHGYDVTTGEIIYPDDPRDWKATASDADGSLGSTTAKPPAVNSSDNQPPAKVDKVYYGDSFPPMLIIISLLGLPSRPSALVDKKGNIRPGYSIFWDLFKNLVGGVDWTDKTSDEKKFFQLAGTLIPIKPLFLALNLLAWPFRLAIVIIKAFTEVLPLVAAHIAYGLCILPYRYAVKLYNKTQAGFSSAQSSYDTISPTWASWVGKIWTVWGVRLFSAIGTLLTAVVGLVSVVTGAVYVVTRFAIILGLLITAPVQAASRVKAALDSLNKKPTAEDIKDSPIATVVLNFLDVLPLGTLVATISYSLSFVLWALVFPLTLNHIAYFYPFVLQGVAWVFHLPVISTVYAAFTGLLATITTPLSAFFAPSMVILSNFLGVQITTAGIVGALSAAIGFPLTYIAVKLSNKWAVWHETGFFTDLFNFEKNSSSEIPVAEEEEGSPLLPAKPPAKPIDIVDRRVQEVVDRVDSRNKQGSTGRQPVEQPRSGPQQQAQNRDQQPSGRTAPQKKAAPRGQPFVEMSPLPSTPNEWEEFNQQVAAESEQRSRSGQNRTQASHQGGRPQHNNVVTQDAVPGKQPSQVRGSTVAPPPASVRPSTSEQTFGATTLPQSTYGRSSAAAPPKSPQNQTAPVFQDGSLGAWGAQSKAAPSSRSSPAFSLSTQPKEASSGKPPGNASSRPPEVARESTSEAEDFFDDEDIETEEFSFK